jgi:CRP/FNR family cyclic AMP-dependent transcriptional regulator
MNWAMPNWAIRRNHSIWYKFAIPRVLERDRVGSVSLLRMPIDASILSEIDHLRELGAGDRTALAEKIDLMVYSAGETVFNLGDPGHALYIVRSGEVEIYLKNDQGEKIVLETARPGDIFGEVSLLDDGPRTAWVAAINDVEVLRLDRAHFEDYVRQHTSAALNLLSVSARRLRKSDEFIRHTITRNVNDVAEEQQTSVSRIADAVPALVGNLPSTLLHGLFFGGWIAVNLGIAGALRRFDPFPFGLLSVIISLEAIFLTLFVLTSQNRQRARDRIRSDIEFETSINTEVKIARLHEKVDKLTQEHYEVLDNTRKLLAGSGGKNRT